MVGAYYARGEQAQDTIHGDLHSYRVSVFAACLCSSRYKRSARIAGLYHDIARVNDQSDPGHGFRSASRALELGLIPASEISAAKAIRMHDAILCNQSSEDPLCVALKTADALDRYRLPKTKWWPNKNKMNNPPDDAIFRIAYKLVIYSELEYLRIKDSVSAMERAVVKLRGEVGLCTI